MGGEILSESEDTRLKNAKLLEDGRHSLKYGLNKAGIIFLRRHKPKDPNERNQS
jgi:hypothetical protein